MLSNVVKKTLPIFLSLGFSCIASGYEFDELIEKKQQPEYEKPVHLQTHAKIKKPWFFQKSKYADHTFLPGDTPWIFAGAKWDPRSGDSIDLDLNITVTKGNEIIGSVNYENAGECQFSGKWHNIIKKSRDDTDGKGRKGAEDEAIGINLLNLKEKYPEADGVYFSLTSFKGDKFGDVENEALDLFTFNKDESGLMLDIFDEHYKAFSENEDYVAKRIQLTTYDLDKDESMESKKAVLFVRLRYLEKSNEGPVWMIEPIGEACTVDSPTIVKVEEVEDDIKTLIAKEKPIVEEEIEVKF